MQTFPTNPANYDLTKLTAYEAHQVNRYGNYLKEGSTDDSTDDNTIDKINQHEERAMEEKWA